MRDLKYMNYDQARQLVNLTWHYTRMNDDRIYPIGYCADHDGHITQKEAEDCYKKYTLDNNLIFGSIDNAQFKCEICGVWTSKDALINGWHIYHLCDEHCNRTTVETLYDCSGESMHS